MKLRNYVFAAVVLASVTFVSCNPDSIADEDNPYQTEQGVDKTKIRIPGQANS
ncbi:hypothetical protein C8N46_104229 [Kordia periserrulae]|uniref:Uncharacterized protein n=1 Tax=Kordia periserrulae TaxID=701523 RepID=A0A2T6BZV6_9FLAO|nr:hypothetical protein [Kordia periserrulae]PTX61586.1 hypothetical protein C8N46_104229 [Kordia periserrulae]